MSDDLVERADGIVKQARAVAYNDARYRKLLTALAEEIERLHERVSDYQAACEQKQEIIDSQKQCWDENRALREEIERLTENIDGLDALEEEVRRQREEIERLKKLYEDARDAHLEEIGAHRFTEEQVRALRERLEKAKSWLSLVRHRGLARTEAEAHTGQPSRSDLDEILRVLDGEGE